MKAQKSELIERIHAEAIAVAANFKRCEIDLIEILEKADAHRIYYAYGFNSLFTYTTGALKLSEEVAYIYIAVARKTREVPALKEDIRHGKITVFKAKRLTAVLNEGNQERWLSLARNSSKRDLEKEIAIASPQHAVREKIEYICGDVEENVKILNLPKLMVMIQTALPEAAMMDIRRVQDLESQAKQTSVTLAETLAAMAKVYLHHKDPLEKAKRQKLRGKLQLGPGPVNVDAASTVHDTTVTRRPLKASTRHQLNLKFQYQCAHIDKDGKRCPQRRFLHDHHIISISDGGSDELENLEILCAGYHQARHLAED